MIPETLDEVHLFKVEICAIQIYAATFFQNWTPNEPEKHAQECVERAVLLVKALERYGNEHSKKTEEA
jgi:hypothetical protein